MSDVVQEDKNDQGTTITFACKKLISQGLFPEVQVPYYYELRQPCINSVSQSMALISSDLLRQAATGSRILPTAAGCSEPPDEGSIWLASVSSGEPDNIENSIGCQRLKPEKEGECCTVVKGDMTFQPIGDYEEIKMKSLVASMLEANNYSFSANSEYKTAFIGSELEISPEAGRVNLRPAINKIEPIPRPQTMKGNNGFTIVGAFVLGGLIAAFIGILALLIDRRRRYLNPDTDPALCKSVADVKMQQDSNDTEVPSVDVDVGNDSREAKDGTPYTFDLSDHFQNQVMGSYCSHVHGPTTMAATPPFPMMEEGSDGETDSWAQTDGTVGSLEERLEEITAEI